MRQLQAILVSALSAFCCAAFSVSDVSAQSLGGTPIREPGVDRSGDNAAHADTPKIALIIENSTYRTEDTSPDNPIQNLTNPKKDAALIAKALEHLGFEQDNIDIVEDADIGEMLNAVQQHTNRLRNAGEDAIGFFYYAGHGLAVGGANYLAPVNSNILEPVDVLTQALSLQQITNPISQAGNRVNLIILDACRNYPFRDGRMTPVGGLAQASFGTQAGFLLAYSAAPGTVARDAGLDTPENYSPYAYALAYHMSFSAHMPIKLTFENVANDVYKSTNHLQIPWEEGFIPSPTFCLGGCRDPGPQAPLQIIVDVNGLGPYKSIQKGVNDVAEGGTIYVMPGVYNESVSVSKSVLIQGWRLGSDVEINAPMNAPCLKFSPRNPTTHAVIANVSFFAKINSQASACVDVAQGVFTLKESDVLGSGISPAILISGGTATIEKNRISAGSVGVQIEQAHSLSQNFILDNKILQNKVGVDIASGSRASVSTVGNYIFDNLDAGVRAAGYGPATIIGNKIRNNKGSGIILDKYAQLALVRFNNILENSGDGIAVPFGVNGVIEDNQIVGNKGISIFLREGLEPTMANNTIENNDGDQQPD